MEGLESLKNWASLSSSTRLQQALRSERLTTKSVTIFVGGDNDVEEHITTKGQPDV